MQWTLSDVSEKMRDIDFTILSTHSDGGHIAGRPMSNNRDVEYDGDSYFFAFEDSRTVQDIQRDPKVALSFTGSRGLLGKPPVFIAAEGISEIIRDKGAFEEHWTGDMDAWAPQGVDTPGLVLIKVHAARIHYWNGEEQGELMI